MSSLDAIVSDCLLLVLQVVQVLLAWDPCDLSQPSHGFPHSLDLLWCRLFGTKNVQQVACFLLRRWEMVFLELDDEAKCAVVVSQCVVTVPGQSISPFGPLVR